MHNNEKDITKGGQIMAESEKLNSAEEYCYRGNKSYNQGEFDHAIADYDRALSLDPNYALDICLICMQVS